MSQRNGNCAGAGANVHDARLGKIRREIRRERKNLLHQVLGFGPGNEHVAIHVKGQPVELGLAGDVLDGLAGQAALDERVVADGPFGVRESHADAPSGRRDRGRMQMQQQQLGIAAGALRMRPGAQARFAFQEPLLQSHGSAAWLQSAFNCSAW